MTSNFLHQDLGQFNNQSAIDGIRTAVTILENLGILQFLRYRGAARVVDAGRNSSANAAEGARAAGYAECLEDLQYFREKYILNVTPPNEVLQPFFGAHRKLVESGDYTKEELDEFRRTGKLPTRPAE